MIVRDFGILTNVFVLSPLQLSFLNYRKCRLRVYAILILLFFAYLLGYSCNDFSQFLDAYITLIIGNIIGMSVFSF